MGALCFDDEIDFNVRAGRFQIAALRASGLALVASDDGTSGADDAVGQLLASLDSANDEALNVTTLQVGFGGEGGGLWWFEGAPWW